jgi:hypothetical protein
VTVSEELSKYQIDLVGIHEVTLDRKENENRELGTGFAKYN